MYTIHYKSLCPNDIESTKWQNILIKYILSCLKLCKPATLQKVSKFFWKNEYKFLEKEWLSRLFIIKVYHWNKCCQVLYFNDDPRHEEKMCIDKMSNFSSLISSVFLIGFLSILNPCFVTSVKGKACKNLNITLSKIVFSYRAF